MILVHAFIGVPFPGHLFVCVITWEVRGIVSGGSDAFQHNPIQIQRQRNGLRARTHMWVGDLEHFTVCNGIFRTIVFVRTKECSGPIISASKNVTRTGKSSAPVCNERHAYHRECNVSQDTYKPAVLLRDIDRPPHY